MIKLTESGNIAFKVSVTINSYFVPLLLTIKDMNLQYITNDLVDKWR